MTAPSLPLEKKPPRVTWLQLLTIAVLTVAVFMPIYHTWYSPLDDFLMLTENDDVTKPSWAAVWRSWTEPSFRIYMPLTLTIWQTIAKFTLQGTPGKPDYNLPVTGFKIASLLVHGLAAAGAAWSLSTLTRTRWPAVIGALVFAFHPVMVESVAWTTGLKDELCGLFSILSVGLYARHVLRDPDKPVADGWWWGAMATAVLAMLCKPTAMITPLLLFAVDLTFRRVAFVRRFLSIGPLLLPAIGCGLIAVAIQGNAPVARLPLHLRPLLAADSLAFYVWKAVWPTNLAIDYGRRPTEVLASGAIWWTWLLPAAIFALICFARSPKLWLAAGLFVIPIMPVSGITAFDMQQYSTVTDHYAYQPMFGLGLLVALSVARWPGLFGTAMVVIACVLATLTVQTATRWQNILAFYRDIERVNAKSWLARPAHARRHEQAGLVHRRPPDSANAGR
ncbi:MAG: hypothetical protein QM754_10325 [Tepidisphaeraceae bacterium]